MRYGCAMHSEYLLGTGVSTDIASGSRPAGEEGRAFTTRRGVIVVRIRPVFWCLLACSCLGLLIFAAAVRTQVPAVMRIQLAQQSSVSNAPTTLYLLLTDTQGTPIEQASVTPSAAMTNMVMVANQVSVRSLGQGKYLVQMLLYMAGPWEIRIVATADGFAPLQRTLYVQVQ
jgi:YtkA-like